MFLIYTDESGKDLKKSNEGFYRDGPCFLYGGLAIESSKSHLLETSFKALCKEILGVESIYEREIHTGDIFYSRRQFKDLDFSRKEEFFREIFQLLSKFNTTLIVGVVYKDTNLFSTDLEKIASAIYAFFSAADYFLLSHGKYGLIIADELENDIRNIRELLNKENLLGRRGGIKLSFLIRRIYFERLNRFSEHDLEPILKLKFKFESKIYALIDNIHYVNSKLSLFNQLSDITLFILNILFEVSEGKKRNTMDTNFLIKEKLVNSTLPDLEFFLQKTKSTISFLYKPNGEEENYDTVFENSYVLGLRNILRTIKERQASGT